LPLPAGDPIPYYYWDALWKQASLSLSSKEEWAVYKFLSHGGLERQVKSLSEEDLMFCETANVAQAAHPRFAAGGHAPAALPPLPPQPAPAPPPMPSGAYAVSPNQPRCRAYGEYQDDHMIFQCYGSTTHGDSDSQNQFIVHFNAGEEKDIVVVPAGTINFKMSLKPLHATNNFPGQIMVFDAYGQNIIRDQMKPAHLPKGNEDLKWSAKVGNLTIDYWEHLGNPRSQQVVVHNKTYHPLTIRAKNRLHESMLIRFAKYHYDPYGGDGDLQASLPPMCKYGAMPEGCNLYDQVWAREYASSFCNDVMKQYDNVDLAWQGMAPDPSGAIPYYYWRHVWKQVSQDVKNVNGHNSMKVWKFLTHGGFETHNFEMEKGQLAFCWKLNKVSIFAKGCCGFLTGKFENVSVAWESAKEINAKDPVWGIWHYCKHLDFAPEEPRDYVETYLNADGYQGVLPRDLDYCWNPRGTTPKPIGPVLTTHPYGSTVYRATTPHHTTTVPPPTTTPRTGPLYTRPYYACLTQRAHRGDTKVVVDDAHGAKFLATDDFEDGTLGTNITIGGVEWHIIQSVDSKHDITLATPVEGYFPRGVCIWKVMPRTTPPPFTTAIFRTTTFHWNGGDDLHCHWTPAKQCRPSFQFKGITYRGCTTAHSKTGAWCSEVDDFAVGRPYHRCTWNCVSKPCLWQKDKECVDQFAYKGHMVGTCQKYKYNDVWCSTLPKYDGKSFKTCTWNCSCYWKPDWKCHTTWTYKGKTRHNCITDDREGRGWCSHDSEFQGKWSPCFRFCPQPESGYPPIPKPTLVSATKCSWKPAAKCKMPFQFEGETYNKCAQNGLDAKSAWCSLDSEYNDKWAHCEWKCEIPVKCGYQPVYGCSRYFQMQGKTYAGCHAPDSRHVQPWCSTAYQYSGKSKECVYDCPCFWVPDPECSLEWTIGAGVLAEPAVHHGCAVTNGKGWCSVSAEYDGHWRWCSWNCLKGPNDHPHQGPTTTHLWRSDMGTYAAVGAGAGAGASALGLGAYGIAMAAQANSRRRGVLPNDNAGIAALQANAQSNPVLGGFEAMSNVAKASVHPYRRLESASSSLTIVALILSVSLCSALCCLGLCVLSKQTSKHRRQGKDAESRHLVLE
jgi:hypothetical protein